MGSWRALFRPLEVYRRLYCRAALGVWAVGRGLRDTGIRRSDGGILMLDASGRWDERAGREPWLWWEEVIGGLVRRERASLRQIFLLFGYITLI
jgi:hypothetical protein